MCPLPGGKMIVKRVNRYYCEYCRKSGGAAKHIKKHEERCTLNPNRKCGVCGMIEATMKPMKDLIALLPNHEEFKKKDAEYNFEYYEEGLTVATNKALPVLRELCENCPACILAALRQAHIPTPMVTTFNYTKEMKSIWDDINSANLQKEYY